MGLGEDLLVNPSSISETLRCPVCFEVFEDPVFCGGRPCQHVFCRLCVERALLTPQVDKTDTSDYHEGHESSEGVDLGHGHCPSCRAEMHLHDLQPHQVVRSLLDELQVRCPRACGWTGRRDALGTHESPGHEQCPLLRLEAANAEIAFLHEAGTHLRARDARIAELETRVSEQDRNMVDIGSQLLAREVKIAELEGKLKEQADKLQQKEMELAMVRRGGLMPAPDPPRGARELGLASSARQSESHAEEQASGGTDLWL
mmetsp:Transcript_7429/g.13188  ORF Transcript_7429/g.13188 Transcript_7429/m.13188 type:complete len:259 (-) Transcript_7429:56-832(-)